MTNEKTKMITVMGLLTACVIILQLLPIRIGVFQLALVGIPVLFAGVLYGALASGFLGLVFSVVVLLNGDANVFLAFSAGGAITTVLAKGTLAGLFCGAIYGLFKKKNYFAMLVSSIIFPIANTSIFVIGVYTFFRPLVEQMMTVAGFTGGFGSFVIFGLIGFNFIVELLCNILFSVVIFRVLKNHLPERVYIKKKEKKEKGDDE